MTENMRSVGARGGIPHGRVGREKTDDAVRFDGWDAAFEGFFRFGSCAFLATARAG